MLHEKASLIHHPLTLCTSMPAHQLRYQQTPTCLVQGSSILGRRLRYFIIIVSSGAHKDCQPKVVCRLLNVQVQCLPQAVVKNRMGFHHRPTSSNTYQLQRRQSDMALLTDIHRNLIKKKLAMSKLHHCHGRTDAKNFNSRKYRSVMWKKSKKKSHGGRSCEPWTTLRDRKKLHILVKYPRHLLTARR